MALIAIGKVNQREGSVDTSALSSKKQTHTPFLDFLRRRELERKDRKFSPPVLFEAS